MRIDDGIVALQQGAGQQPAAGAEAGGAAAAPVPDVPGFRQALVPTLQGYRSLAAAAKCALRLAADRNILPRGNADDLIRTLNSQGEKVDYCSKGELDDACNGGVDSYVVGDSSGGSYVAQPPQPPNERVRLKLLQNRNGYWLFWFKGTLAFHGVSCAAH